MRKTNPWIVTLAAAVLLAACAGQKEPATKAIASAESALAEVSADAAQYAPDDLAGVQSTLTGLKDNLAKGDYKAVLAGAGGLTTSIAALKDTVAAKKSEMEAAMAAATTEWSSMAGDLPKMVEAIGSRIGVLSKSKRLPKGIDQASFDSAKSGYEMMQSTWSEATAAAASGNVMDAVAKAKMVKDKGAEVMQMLNMSAG
ncbi:MAG TPA: hypothetical protein P5528_02980 [Steroidobacteraceae bacterium]|nr:hypothetical protein [Steroidobacteraceae bacterium]HRX88387.1 hypothetical protein [Steroidobacteraceae bacterium]